MGLIATLMKLFVDYRYTGMVDFTVFWSSLGAGLFFLILVLLTQGKGMGIGDVKFGFLMGMILGWPNILLALMFAFLTGAAVGVILIILKRKGLKSKIAFGPFLVLGTLFSLFYGQIIWLKLFP
jgi:prepilin signal peptidase PulO-like enzyme (type II secretory pathway)